MFAQHVWTIANGADIILQSILADLKRIKEDLWYKKAKEMFY